MCAHMFMCACVHLYPSISVNLSHAQTHVHTDTQTHTDTHRQIWRYEHAQSYISAPTSSIFPIKVRWDICRTNADRSLFICLLVSFYVYVEVSFGVLWCRNTGHMGSKEPHIYIIGILGLFFQVSSYKGLFLYVCRSPFMCM